MSTITPHRPVTARPTFWAILCAVVLAAAAGTILALNALVYSPTAAVKDYVEALRQGDGATAVALSQAYLPQNAPETTSTVLLDGPALAASAEILEHATFEEVDGIPDAYVQDGVTQQVVNIEYGGTDGATYVTPIVVDKTGTTWLFFEQWSLHPLPLQQVMLHPRNMPDHSKADEPVAQLNGADTALLGAEGAPAVIASFAPATVSLEYTGTYLEVPEPAMFVVSDVLAPGASVDFAFPVALTSDVDEAINAQVRQELQRCTDQTVLKPAGCPFGYETAHRVVPDSVQWSLDDTKVSYAWQGSEPRIEWINATATLTAQEIHIGTGAQSTVEYEEDFEMDAQLSLTPEHLNVRPQWQ